MTAFNLAGRHRRIPSARNQTGPLKHLKVLGDGGQTYGERRRDAVYSRLSTREHRADRLSCRISKCREGALHVSVRHLTAPSVRKRRYC